MDGNTTVHIAEWGNCKEESEITSWRWQVMLQEAGVLPIAQPEQPAALPVNLIETMREAADIINSIDPERAPENMRWSIIDELHNFGLMLAQPVQPEQPAGWITEKGVQLLMRTEYERGYRQCNYDCIDAIVQPVQPAELNFCARCGKRLGSSADIHTCSLPEPVTHKRDALVVNLLRLTNLDKHTARAIADAALEGEK